MSRTPEQAAKVAEMRKQVFAKQMTFSEFHYQVQLLDGKVQSREEHAAQVRAEIQRQRDFHEQCAKLL